MTASVPIAWMRKVLEAGAGARGRALLAYGAFTFLVFLVSLVLTLPHDLIARRALEAATADAPVRANFDGVSFAFPTGYRFTDVVIAPQGDPAHAVEIDTLTVRLPLMELLTANPRSALLSGEAYGGTFDGSVTNLGTRFETDVRIDGLDLGRATAAFVPPPGRVTGRASLALQLSGDGRTTRSSKGKVDLSGQDIAVDKLTAQGVLLPDLRFGEVLLRAEIDGARLQIGEFRADGDELDLGAKGDVLVREPIVQSTLNLQLQLDVASSARPGLRVATNLLPKRTSPTQPYTLRGTLASPTLR